jgi:MoaA/NifB/PqqE/SkfB family radical SAM enzyme
MLTAFLLLTDKCNLDCSFCINKQNNFPRVSESLNINDNLNFIKVLSKYNVTDLILTGGEPLILSEELNKIIYEATKYNINTLLLSNGKNLSSDEIAKLKKSGLNNITISFNELTYLDSINKKYRDYISKYKKIISDVLKLYDNVTVTILISNKNFKLLSAIYNEFDNEKVSIIFQPVNDKNLGLEKLSDEDWKELKIALYDWSEKYNKLNYVQVLYNLYNEIGLGNIDCIMGTYAFVINYDGMVYNCFHRPDLCSGNILMDDPKKIFTNLINNSSQIIDGNCIGKHCISLFFNLL